MADLLADVLEGNSAYVARFDPHALGTQPARRLAVVTCMDSRIDALPAFGLRLGDAHVIRNAGAVVTDDVERSLLLSQYAMGTRTVLVIGHTDCGVVGHDEDATIGAIEARRGRRPPMSLGSLTTPGDGVRRSVDRLRGSPYLAHTDDIWGFVYDVHTGLLTHIDI